MVVISVLYPAKPDSRFDRDYYMATHIPLVEAAFGETGLTSVQVFHGLPAPDGAAPPFVAMAHLHFESAEALQRSLSAPRAAEVAADLANFTDITPTTQVSEVGR